MMEKIEGSEKITIVKVLPGMETTVAMLAQELWPHHETEELEAEFEGLLGCPEAALFLAEEGGIYLGFAQCQLRRDYVEGTKSSPVGYLEGIYVTPKMQGKGIGRKLLAACEAWAKEQGCEEFASDCELDNQNSFRFHRKVGFEEANRIICFVKEI